MEILALELAKILNITVEKAVELFPIIRQQFIYYNILDSLMIIPALLIGISVVATTVFHFFYYGSIKFLVDKYYVERCDYDGERKIALRYKKLAKISLVILIISISLLTTLSISKYIISPDFMILKEFIIK